MCLPAVRLIDGQPVCLVQGFKSYTKQWLTVCDLQKCYFQMIIPLRHGDSFVLPSMLSFLPTNMCKQVRHDDIPCKVITQY